MSTIIVMQTDRAVHWITDAGQYDPDTGNLVAVRSKVYELPGGVAFAWRGAGGEWYDLIADRLRAMSGIEEMALALPGLAADLHHRAGSITTDDAPAGGWQMEIWLAGWHAASGRPICAWLSSEPLAGDPYGPEPFQIREAPSFTMAPGPLAPLNAVLGWELSGATVDRLDPVSDGLKLIEAQRIEPQRGGYCVAGGRAELTRIDRIGVTCWVLKDWNDPIGYPIDPENRQADADRRVLNRLATS